MYNKSSFAHFEYTLKYFVSWTDRDTGTEWKMESEQDEKEKKPTVHGRNCRCWTSYSIFERFIKSQVVIIAFAMNRAMWGIEGNS